MRTYRVLGVVLGALCCSVQVHAQDARKVGITMGFPPSVGLIVPISSRIAIRPDFTASGASTSQDQLQTLAAHSWNLAAEVGVLVYLRQNDKLRTYVVPEFDYTLNSMSTNNVSVNASGLVVSTGSSTTSRIKSVGAATSFGARYALADRFAVYGEVGFGFSHSSLPSAASSIPGTVATGWGTRGGVGVVFYP